jgi:hypothetical protein
MTHELAALVPLKHDYVGEEHARSTGGVQPAGDGDLAEWTGGVQPAEARKSQEGYLSESVVEPGGPEREAVQTRLCEGVGHARGLLHIGRALDCPLDGWDSWKAIGNTTTCALTFQKSRAFSIGILNLGLWAQFHGMILYFFFQKWHLLLVKFLHFRSFAFSRLLLYTPSLAAAAVCTIPSHFWGLIAAFTVQNMWYLQERM